MCRSGSRGWLCVLRHPRCAMSATPAERVRAPPQRSAWQAGARCRRRGGIRSAHRRSVVAQLAAPQALHWLAVGVHACAAEQGDRARNVRGVGCRACLACVWQAVRVRRPTRHAGAQAGAATGWRRGLTIVAGEAHVRPVRAKAWHHTTVSLRGADTGSSRSDVAKNLCAGVILDTWLTRRPAARLAAAGR